MPRASLRAHAQERDEREHGYGYGCGDDDQFEPGDRAAKAGRPASDHDADGHKERQRDPAEQGRAPELERGRSRVRQLEQQDANLRRALRSAGPNAAERITLEIEAVAVELREATTSLSITEVTERPLRVTSKVVRQTIDEMTGILEHAPLDTRVAWVRDLFERIDVDSRESHAVAVWKAVTDEGVNRLDSVSEWLRRAGHEVALVVVRFGLRGGEIELPPSAGPWRVVLSSHDLATPTVGSRVAVRPIEAIVLQRVAHTIHG